MTPVDSQDESMSVYMDAAVADPNEDNEIVIFKDRGANAAMKSIEHQCINNNNNISNSIEYADGGTKAIDDDDEAKKTTEASLALIRNH